MNISAIKKEIKFHFSRILSLSILEQEESILSIYCEDCLVSTGYSSITNRSEMLHLFKTFSNSMIEWSAVVERVLFDKDELCLVVQVTQSINPKVLYLFIAGILFLSRCLVG
jgi:hypothetical protein